MKKKFLSIRTDADVSKIVRQHCLSNEITVTNYILGLIKRDLEDYFQVEKVLDHLKMCKQGR